MKVLLISPPNVHVIEPFCRANKTPPPLAVNFPLGLGYLAAILEKNQFKVEILDACYENDITIEVIEKKIKEFHPDIVGLSVYTALAKTAVKIAQITKEIDSKIKVIAGGPHATYDYKNLLTNYPVDFVVLGEGELTFLELLNKLRNNETDFESVKGIAFMKDKVYATDKRPPIENLDSLPYPARHLVDFKKYINSPHLLPNAAYIVSSRGCSHQCVFCSQSHFQKKWRPRSPENVIEEMKYLLKTYDDIKSFQFFDDNFTFKKDRVINICELIIKNNLQKYKWNCLARVDQVDLEMMQLMKQAGCEKISFGVESGSPQVLKNIHKGISLDRIKEAFNLASRVGIESMAFFMIGNPGETEETITESIKFARKLKSTSTLFGITQVYPGTGLAEKSPQINFIEYIYEPEINNSSPFIHPCVAAFEQPGLDREKLKLIQKGILKKFLIYHSFRNFKTYLKHFIRSPINSLKYASLLFKKI